MYNKITSILGDEAKELLGHKCMTILKELIHLPGADFIDRVFGKTDRSNNVLRNLATLFNHGRLAGTGYLSILPVDQGVEHSGAASFDPRCLPRKGYRHRVTSQLWKQCS